MLTLAIVIALTSASIAIIQVKEVTKLTKRIQNLDGRLTKIDLMALDVSEMDKKLKHINIATQEIGWGLEKYTEEIKKVVEKEATRIIFTPLEVKGQEIKSLEKQNKK